MIEINLPKGQTIQNVAPKNSIQNYEAEVNRTSRKKRQLHNYYKKLTL